MHQNIQWPSFSLPAKIFSSTSASLVPQYGLFLLITHVHEDNPKHVHIMKQGHWWSGHSMTPHIVLDLRSPIWGFCKNCTIVHGITSQSTNVFSNVPHWHFWRSPTVRLQLIKSGTFRISVLGLEGCGVRWMGPFDSLPMGSYLLPVDT